MITLTTKGLRMAKQYISTKDAAELIGITESMVRRLARDGKLTGKRFGRDWQIELEAARGYKPRRKREQHPQD